jgi:alkylhydroperoxidase family enzyme
MTDSSIGGDRFVGLVARVRESVLEGPGVTTPDLRQAVEERAAAMSGRTGESGDSSPLSADLAEFADKVAGGAWRITDEEVAALLQSGYSEDEVFEVSVSAALGAASARLERGLAALRGEV